MTQFNINDDDRQQLIEAFAAESDETLDKFEELLLQLEETPQDDELLNEIFRAAHTMKGNAACLQFDELTSFAHVIEELLDGMRDGRVFVTAACVSQLLDSADVLRDLARRSVAGNGSLTTQQQSLFRSLAEFASRRDGRKQEAPEWERGQQAMEVRASSPATSLRVRIEKLDRMLNLAGEIAVARGHVRQLAEEGETGDRMFDAIRDLDRLSFELQESIMSVRLVPVGPALRHFHRVVRDVAASRQKKVDLILEGEDVEIDTTIMEQLKDPLTHMIRNAIDHGIETPDERIAAGKAPGGLIRISALHAAGGVVIRVSDDGAGLDEALIAARARTLGLDPDRLTRQEIRDLILTPGFSTATSVTDLSGRGVGMDVVRRNVESLRGTLSIGSESGAGTTITINVPLTVAVIEGFVVGVGSDTFVIPIDAVIECTEMPPNTGEEQKGVIDLRGEPLPFLRLRNLFGLERGSPARENVVVVQHEHGRAGIVVDALFGDSQVVMKPLGRVLQKIPGIAGSSIMGNGRVALILDVYEFIRRAAA
jgi:two-component system, chemotaxis family, sensor kinase CheA